MLGIILTRLLRKQVAHPSDVERTDSKADDYDRTRTLANTSREARGRPSKKRGRTLENTSKPLAEHIALHLGHIQITRQCSLIMNALRPIAERPRTGILGHSAHEPSVNGLAARDARAVDVPLLIRKILRLQDVAA